jgi:hypothetical protein
MNDLDKNDLTHKDILGIIGFGKESILAGN